MSLIINGTTIPSSGSIKYNGTDLKKVICNGVTVWEKIVFETKDVSYNGGVQCVTVPPGLYKLEVWGAQGGEGYLGGRGGYGGYSCRYYYFSQQTALYVCVGGAGSMLPNGASVPVSGGYNGGKCWNKFFTYALNMGTGGGATHISKDASGVLSDFMSTRSKVLVVAGGGGGGSGTSSGTGARCKGTGGAGGGLTGGDGIPDSNSYNTNCGLGIGKGGTQSAGGKTPNNGYDGYHTNDDFYTVTYDGKFGIGGYCTTSCWTGGTGGGGWYGGGAGNHHNGGSPGGGGSGYIGVSSMVHNGITYTNTSTAGVNQGNGKAKITYIAA